MERYIAIDNVCAWPNLTKMPDGAITAVIFNQPCHGLWEGDVECWASEDGGRLWHLRGTPTAHEPGTNRMNVAAGLAINGDLLIIVSGWSHRPRQGEGSAGHGAPAHPLLPWICRSGDGGRSWIQTATLPPSALPSTGAQPAHIIPFGDIVQMQDGSLGVCIYSQLSPHERNCCFYASTDDGHSWMVRGIIQEDDINETAPLVLPDGELLACARTVDDQHLELFRSSDYGKSWQREQTLSAGLQHPAHLLNLKNGRVLLTYGDRRKNHHGIVVCISDDAGHTWSTPERLVNLEPADLGYPATVPGDEGALVTAWYSRGIAAHQRYHMGAAVWKVDEVFTSAQ